MDAIQKPGKELVRLPILIFVIVTFTFTGLAAAQDLGRSREYPLKSTLTVPYLHSGAAIEDGDTVGDALVIGGLPFTHTGSTDGYADDYDAICPYDTPGSPDVVFTFTPLNDLLVAVDLCGSDYDTKTYIYDAELDLIACNDDFYSGEPGGQYVSKIEMVVLEGGVTYYIVIDGYGGAFGVYELLVEEIPFCEVACPPDAINEGEPPLEDGYIDEYNSGCGGPGLFWQAIDWINDDDGQLPYTGPALLCGKSGWYQGNSGEWNRDTDWFVVEAGEPGEMEVTLASEYPCYLLKLAPTNCWEVEIEISVETDFLSPASMTFPVTMLEEIWLWVAPKSFEGPVNEFTYVMTVTNNRYNTVDTEDMSWDRVKSLYR